MMGEWSDLVSRSYVPPNELVSFFANVGILIQSGGFLGFSIELSVANTLRKFRQPQTQLSGERPLTLRLFLVGENAGCEFCCALYPSISSDDLFLGQSFTPSSSTTVQSSKLGVAQSLSE